MFQQNFGTLRGILKRAGIVGIDDQTKKLNDSASRRLHFPDSDQFPKILEIIETSGAEQSQYCAILFAFLLIQVVGFSRPDKCDGPT